MKFEGLFTAIITPFKTDESIDKDALRSIIKFQIESRVDAVVPCTVTGENATLSHIEHEWVVEWTVRYVNKRIGVIAATGSNSTQEAIRLSLHAQKVGADAVLLLSPYLNMPSQKGLYLHFKTIAEKLEIPCILHNLKSQTNVNIETATVVKLATDCPNIIGFCEVSENLDQAREIRANTHSSFKVYSGLDHQATDVIREGGNGVFSIAANIVPEKMRQLVHYARHTDYRKAEEITEKLADLMSLLQHQPDPVPVKTILSQMNLCVESFRLPICSIEDGEFRAHVQQVMHHLQLV